MEKNIEAKNKEVEFAKAEARRLREEAEGRAAANKIIADSLDERLLRLKAIEAQMAFANQGTHTVLIPQGQPLITNVGK
jgi:regulator of protease activity HflC (stomatin/prohibitin superfamily)